MKKTVFLPVEVQKREWLAKLYLALVLCSKGYSIVIGRHYQVMRYALTQRDGIYIDKSFFYSNFVELQKLKNQGFQILAWDEEGLIVGAYDEYCSQRLGERTLEICDVIFAWGKKQAEYIKCFLPQVENRVVVVGNPRIDLLRTESGRIYVKKIDEIKKRYGQYILVNTNFIYATDENIYEREKKMFMAQQKDGNAAMRTVREQISQTKVIKEKFVEAIISLAKALNNTIIVRPHPIEEEKIYASEFTKYKNIVVTKEYDVNTWIHGAAVVIHNTCTTGMESFIAGKPTISFLPDGLYTYEDSVSNRISLVVTTKEDLLEKVKFVIENPCSEIVNNIFFTDDRYNELKKYVEFSKLESSSEIISKYLDSSNVSNQKEDVMIYWEYIKEFIKNQLNFYKFHDDSEYKWRPLRVQDIKKDIQKICAMSGKKIKVRPVFKDVYLLKAW